MDSFFASIEEINNPQFKGKPIVVGADPKEGYGRGVVSTANYKAREYGIHSAMPITKAWQASEKAKSQGKEGVVFLPPDFELYEKSSHNILEIIKKYSDLVEQASIDEFYFDLTLSKTFEKAEAICRKIKEEIKKEEELTCSVGIGPNKLIAKIAAGVKKPNGLFIVQQDNKESFLEPLPIRTIPGIGPKTAELLSRHNISTIRDLKKFSGDTLKEILGKRGEEIYDKARGIDDSSIIENREVKSIGEQSTFEQDTFNIVFIADELEKYCTRLFKRFKQSGFTKFKTISIIVRFSDFETITSAKSFKQPLEVGDIKKFQLEALKLLLPFLDKRKNPQLKKMRLLGVRIENLAK